MHDVTVLSPHRDDAAFSLFLSISHWVERGLKVRVVNFFTESAYAPYVLSDDTNRISAIRRREDRRVLRELDREITVADAGLLDAPLRYRLATEAVCNLQTGLRTTAEEVKALATHFRVGRNEIAIAPLALGDHVDHRAVKLAAIQSVPSRQLAFYEDLPYATWTTREALLERVASAEQQTRRLLRPLIIRANHALYLKRRLVEQYRSQIAGEQAYNIAQWSNNFGGGERLWIPQHSPIAFRQLSTKHW